MLSNGYSFSPELIAFPIFFSDSTLKNVTSDFKKMGKRIFVFIIGGATRSEVKFDKELLHPYSGCCNCSPILWYYYFYFQLRVCHKLTTKLKREVILGTTSMDDPPMYLTVITPSFFATSSQGTVQSSHNSNFYMNNVLILLVDHLLHCSMIFNVSFFSINEVKGLLWNRSILNDFF